MHSKLYTARAMPHTWVPGSDCHCLQTREDSDHARAHHRDALSLSQKIKKEIEREIHMQRFLVLKTYLAFNLGRCVRMLVNVKKFTGNWTVLVMS